MDGMTAIENLLTTLLTDAVNIGLAASALFLAWAGFLYMTASGSPRRMETAKDAAFEDVLWLVLVMFVL
jgi:hypothetical protein